jgi:DNA-binding winged helix-turn-helix (wHTH) protein
MLNSHNLLPGKGKYLFGGLLLLFFCTIGLAFTIADDGNFDFARREVLLRRIGHEVLLQSGDSTSRVLPIQKIAENEYRIDFEREFTFKTDSLMDITQRLLAKDPLASNYVVNVIDNKNSSIAYGYALSKDKKDDVLTCVGRKQPVAKYVIHIKFKQATISTETKRQLWGGLPFVAFIGFIFLRPNKLRQTLPASSKNDMLTLGEMAFDLKNRTLVINNGTIELTGTESRLLRIFALSPNHVIERSRLQKEIWEDEGVIVGRSLDMFISKLRKKMEPYPNISIVVIRGKGYKLQIDGNC